LNSSTKGESGCCLESPVNYSYAPIGEQKCIDPLKSFGNRISILGVWQPEQSFDYALVQGSFNKERYVKVMNAPCSEVRANIEENWTNHGDYSR
jgi:hypothetical protein